MAVDLDVMFSLGDVDTVKHINKALSFERYTEFFVDYVEENGGCMSVRTRDGKIVNLSHENHTGVVYDTGVETWFMHGRCETDVSEDGVGVLFPESW